MRRRSEGSKETFRGVKKHLGTSEEAFKDRKETLFRRLRKYNIWVVKKTF